MTKGFQPGKIAILTPNTVDTSQLEQAINGAFYQAEVFTEIKGQDARHTYENWGVTDHRSDSWNGLLKEYREGHFLLTYAHIDSSWEALEPTLRFGHPSIAIFGSDESIDLDTMKKLLHDYAIDTLLEKAGKAQYSYQDITQNTLVAERMMGIPPTWFRHPDPFCGHCVSFPAYGNRYFAGKGPLSNVYQIHREKCTFRPKNSELWGYYPPWGEPGLWRQIGPAEIETQESDKTVISAIGRGISYLRNLFR